MTINLGLVGAGKWGSNIIQTCEQIPEIQLTHIARHSNNRINIPDSCQLHTDWHELLSLKGIDGVIIATSADIQAEVTKSALINNLPVYVEKPHALTIDDAQSIYDLVNKKSGILKIGYIDLYNSAWQTLLENISLIGDIIKIEAEFGGDGPFRPDIRPLWDWGSHPVALISILFGEPENIEAKYIHHEKTADCVIENIEINMKFVNKFAKVTIGNKLDETHRNIIVEGKSGTLVYDDRKNEKIQFIGDDVKTLSHKKVSPLTQAMLSFSEFIIAGKPYLDDAHLGLLVTKTLADIDAKLH